MTVRTSAGLKVSLLMACGCLLAVAGCSGTTAPPTAAAVSAATSAAKTSAATAISPGSATAAAGTAGSAAAGSAETGKAVCSTLTPADVQFLLADPAAGPTATVIGTDSDGQQCFFNNADDDESVEIDVYPSADPVFGFSAQQQETANPVTVTGVGDKAFRDADDYTPTAEGNGITCSVEASVDQIPAASSLIIGGHSITLNTAQQDAVATALGTICNRIFGSGPTTPDLSSLHN